MPKQVTENIKRLFIMPSNYYDKMYNIHNQKKVLLYIWNYKNKKFLKLQKFNQ